MSESAPDNANLLLAEQALKNRLLGSNRTDDQEQLAEYAFAAAGVSFRERICARGFEDDFYAEPPVYVEDFATHEDVAAYLADAEMRIVAQLPTSR